MAVRKKRIVKKTSSVKKTWVPILAPPVMGSAKIGESYLADADKAIGRKLVMSVSAIRGEPNRNAIRGVFQISGKKEGMLTTELIGLEWLPSSIKKLVRRGRTKLEMSFIAYTADNKKIRIKPLLLTRGKVTSGVTTNIRKLAKAYIRNVCLKNKFEDLASGILQRSFQRDIQFAVKKFHPIAVSEIQKLNIIGDATAEEIEKEKATLPKMEIKTAPKKKRVNRDRPRRFEKPKAEDKPAEKPAEKPKAEEAPQEAPVKEAPAEEAPAEEAA